MCGIVGGVSKRNVLPILVEGLKRLEYRGYDSAGVAFRNNKKVSLVKTQGRVADLESQLDGSLKSFQFQILYCHSHYPEMPQSVLLHPCP